MKERIEIVKGDITKLRVDAIVNAANRSLLGGGGVDYAIHRAAGPQLVEECRLLGGCKTGQAKITGGYNLPADYVIHAVGPVWNGGGQGEAELLASCYRNSFALALENNVKTIAFPAISCGVYGYPIAEAVDIALRETIDFLSEHDAIEKVTFACFEGDVYQAYLDAFARRDA
jgi:O-acetyl-ADP-ribose deacetylase